MNFLFLRKKKGMSIIEVIVSVATLAIVVVPLATSFMNTLIVSKRVNAQTEINAITRIAKEEITNSIINSSDLIEISGSGINLRDTIKNASTGSFEKDFVLKDSLGNINDRYYYTVSYTYADCYDSDYDVYNVNIAIKDKDNNRTMNKIKIAVNVGGEL